MPDARTTDSSPTLVLAVVGHTNTGKTSLLRTLLRDPDFGDVAPQPGTTRHVEAARLTAAGNPLLDLYDTPGLEDAIALLELIERPPPAGTQLDGPARVERFLASDAARGRFEQEAKVLRQLLQSDAGLYVIDAREPVLAKYRDELAILALCGKPLLPVLNFSAGAEARDDTWRDALARLGLHAVVNFDSVAPPLDGEKRLYDSLALLLPRGRDRLERLLADQARQKALRAQAGRRLIAELLIDCGALRVPVADDPVLQQRALEELQQRVRQREQSCVNALLQLHAFRPDDALAGELPLQNARWSDDLFNPETLQQIGIKVGGGMAAGAAAGVGIDLMVGGITLGSAALLGALAGGGAQTLRNYGKRLRDRLRGQRELIVDDAVLRVLALRQLQLLQALEQRGHAALEPVQVAGTDSTWQRDQLPKPLRKARAHPEWSKIGEEYRNEDAARLRALAGLEASLQAAIA